MKGCYYVNGKKSYSFVICGYAFGFYGISCYGSGTVCERESAMAAELSVKENRTRSGIVNVAVPYISGSVGGKQVDNIVNKAVLSYVNSQMKQIMSKEEIETFESTHADPRELGEMLRYNSDLVKYTDKKIVDKNTAGRVTASWYVRNEYEVKAAKDTFYSVILKTKTYTGGAGDVIVWKAMNFDLKDGHLMELKELFDANADYAARLQTLIGFGTHSRYDYRSGKLLCGRPL